jgi:tripeptide aminopeptidase
MINPERLLAEFLELVQVDSPTRSERAIADLLKDRLRALGLSPTEDGAAGPLRGECGNVLTRVRGTVPDAPALLLAAHMDCVAPCQGVKPIVKDGVITSSGDTILGADDKSGIAAILEALRAVRERDVPHGDLLIVFTVAEEGGVNGSKHLDVASLQADLGYVLDASGPPGKIIAAAPGQDRITVTIHGTTAHAGLAPERGVNAIVVAGRALAELRQGRIDDETTANIGTIHGGLATNIVPDQVTLACEARSRALHKLEQQTQHMCATFLNAATAHGARAEVEVSRAYDPYTLSSDSPVVALARTAVRRAGVEPRLEVSGGGSDANILNKQGLPTAVLSTGASKAHTTQESLRVEHLHQAAEIVCALIEIAARTSWRKP